MGKRVCHNCKCYTCGHPHCLRAICHGDNPLSDCIPKEVCGKYIFDGEKMHDILLPPKEAKIEENT